MLGVTQQMVQLLDAALTRVLGGSRAAENAWGALLEQRRGQVEVEALERRLAFGRATLVPSPRQAA